MDILKEIVEKLKYISKENLVEPVITADTGSKTNLVHAEQYWPAFQATLATFRPIILSENVLEKLKEEHEKSFKNIARNSRDLMMMPKINLPFESILLIPCEKYLAFSKADSSLGRAYSIGFLFRFSLEGIYVFSILQPEDGSQLMLKTSPEQGRCIIGVFDLCFGKLYPRGIFGFSLFILKSLESLVVENLMYSRKNSPTVVNYFKGNRPEKRHVSRVNYVDCPREIILNTGDILFSRNIEFTHRFEVMGHWRRILKGKGKDVRGERIETGRTWVSSHERGPKHAPFKEKIRVLKLKKEETGNDTSNY